MSQCKITVHLIKEVEDDMKKDKMLIGGTFAMVGFLIAAMAAVVVNIANAARDVVLNNMDKVKFDD